MLSSHLLSAMVLALNVSPQLIQPPFVRQWTQPVGDHAAVIAVQGGVVYYRSSHGVGALDLAAGKLKWSSLPDATVPAAAIQGQTLYLISMDKQDRSSLDAVDIWTGLARILAPIGRFGGNLVADRSHIYVLDESGRLRAYKPNGAVVWTRELQPGKSQRMDLAQMALTSDGLYAGVDDAGDFAIDPADGHILWKLPSKYSGLYPPLVVAGDVITQSGGLRRINIRTGKVRWKAEEGNGDAALISNVVVESDATALVGHDLNDGHIVWRLPLRDKGVAYGSDGDRTVSEGENAWFDRNPVVCVTREGREVWHRQKPFTGSLVYSDQERVVTLDDFRILGYAAGTLPPLPTTDEQKKSLAERLASQFELLDDAERSQLETLTPYSFGPLLARFVEWTNADSPNEEDENSYPRYSLLKDAGELLEKICTKQDTAAVMAALSNLHQKNEWHGTLEHILQLKGDPARYIGLLVKNLRQLPLKERTDSVALRAVSHSSQPEAVALMLETLRDPGASVEWRQAAFQCLAGTGGPQGVQAVRKARGRRHPQKPWFERIEIPKPGHGGSISIKRDSKGRTWMLFFSRVLGNESDLFIVQKLGGRWGRPLFTGVWTGRTFRREAPKAYHGIPITKLMSTEWIKIFPDDANIRRDSDGDGLTDIVERRLGTNPYKADTDGDGLSDAVDPCPNGPPRIVGDDEKIIAACIEARFFLQDWGAPAVLSVPNVKPFKLYGYKPTLIWEVPGRKIPLSGLYGGGVNLIHFRLPDERSQESKRIIQYDPLHTTARTVISRYSGGLNGDGNEVTLKKIGSEWFVVNIEGKWVS